jgi:tetratricopeptide (TPR) repeat protein
VVRAHQVAPEDREEQGLHVDAHGEVVGGSQLAVLGRDLVRSDHLRLAAAVLDTLRAKVKAENRSDRMALALLRGEIAVAHGRRDEAIRQLGDGFEADSSSYILEPLAHAYAARGDFDAAAPLYERLATRRDRGWEAQEYWTQSHYELGRIHEARGDTAQALRWYGALLEIWKQADPSLPLLRDARAAVTRLQAGGAR